MYYPKDDTLNKYGKPITNDHLRNQLDKNKS